MLIAKSLGQVDFVENRSHPRKMESDLSKSINKWTTISQAKLSWLSLSFILRKNGIMEPREISEWRRYFINHWTCNDPRKNASHICAILQKD